MGLAGFGVGSVWVWFGLPWFARSAHGHWHLQVRLASLQLARTAVLAAVAEIKVAEKATRKGIPHRRAEYAGYEVVKGRLTVTPNARPAHVWPVHESDKSDASNTCGETSKTSECSECRVCSECSECRV